MPQPDHKLRGSLCRSLEKATLISSPPTIILIEFSTMSNAKGVYSSHHESVIIAISRILEVFSLNHIMPGKEGAALEAFLTALSLRDLTQFYTSLLST